MRQDPCESDPFEPHGEEATSTSHATTAGTRCLLFPQSAARLKMHEDLQSSFKVSTAPANARRSACVLKHDQQQCASRRSSSRSP